jgi:hypothetical protein
MELYIVARAAHKALLTLGCEVTRSYVGGMMTSLEMQGMMLTVVLLDDLRLSRLDAPTEAPAWPRPAAGCVCLCVYVCVCVCVRLRLPHGPAPLPGYTHSHSPTLRLAHPPTIRHSHTPTLRHPHP